MVYKVKYYTLAMIESQKEKDRVEYEVGNILYCGIKNMKTN
jgi:hypothetical protein